MKTLKDLREEYQELQEASNYLTDCPNILVLKRQTMRRYPDGLTVGVYWSDVLKQEIAIPFPNVGVVVAPTGKV